MEKELDLAVCPSIPVLDKGYVKFIASMGSDETIVEAARMSTGRGFVSWEPYYRCNKCSHISGKDVAMINRLDCTHDYKYFPRGDFGLLETLYKNSHMTPFEMCELQVETKAPIMVYRERHRHRTFSYNEFSARYSQMPDEHYVPDPSRIVKQSKFNKQGSSLEGFDEAYQKMVVRDIEKEQKQVYRNYAEMCDNDIAREVARLNTPVSRYSKQREKGNLRNWLQFLTLRLNPAAQWEIRQYATAIAVIIKQIWPRSYALFEEYTLGAFTLSLTERKLLHDFLSTTKRDSTEMSEFIDKLHMRLG